MKTAAALGVVVAATLVLPPPAPAGVAIRALDASGFPVVRVTVVTSSPTGRAPTIREDGSRVAAMRAENLGRAKSIVLAIDRSRSMTGGALGDAAAAAWEFAAGKGRADRIALLAFGSDVVELTPFSTQTRDARRALAALAVDRREGTALYDAVVLAAHLLGGEERPGRVLLVVTDGHDVSSGATLRAAVRAARRAGVVVYAIGIEGRGFTPRPLRTLARRTGGIFETAPSSDALAAIYARISRELRRTWRVEYVTAARPGEQVRVRVGFGGLGAAGASLELPGGRPETATPEASWLYDSGFGKILVAVAVALLAYAAARRVGSYRRVRTLRARLAARPVATPVADAGPGIRARLTGGSLFAATERAFGGLRHWRALQRVLDRADVPLRPVELVYAMLGSGVALALLAASFHASPLVLLAAFVAGAAGPYGLVLHRARRRTAAFERQLPEVLMTLAASLKAGHSFRQGIQAVVDEGNDPARKEFGLVLGEARLGRPLEDALAEMAERLGSENLRFVVSAVAVQRQVGGSLAGIFDMVADTVRQREQFARRVKALTAMGRMSAYVLIALPIGLGFALSAINPEYMAPLYGTSAGRMMILVGAILMAFGSLVLRRIVAFKG